MDKLAKRGINNKIEWKFAGSFSAEKEHGLFYRAEFMGKCIQLEIITPVLKDYGGPKEFGEQKIYLFIDGDEREFKTEEDLVNALKEV